VLITTSLNFPNFLFSFSLIFSLFFAVFVSGFLNGFFLFLREAYSVAIIYFFNLFLLILFDLNPAFCLSQNEKNSFFQFPSEQFGK